MRVLAVIVAFYALATNAWLAPRNCARMPSGPDPNVRDEVYLTALRLGANDKVMLATMAAAITETWVNNLNCGDKDSLGVFQQRESQGWGRPDQLMNVEYSTTQFVTLCQALDKTHPGIDAGELAQLVQRAEAGNQYTKNEGLAREYIALAAKSVGRAPPKPTSTTTTRPPAPPKPTASKPEHPAPQPTKSTPAPPPPPPKPTETTSTTVFPTDLPPSPAPTLPLPGLHTLYLPDGVPMTVLAMPSAAAARFDLPDAARATATASAHKVRDCIRSVQPNVGESCSAFAQREGIDSVLLRAINPSLHADCLNLDPRLAYCVEQASA